MKVWHVIQSVLPTVAEIWMQTDTLISVVH